MNRQEYIRAIKDVIYLSYCAVNERRPSDARGGRMVLEDVYLASQKHMLTAMCAMALESAGINDENFKQAKGKAIRKNVQLDIDREQITAMFEAEGIWYMPLKGSVIKDLYPKYGMRQMSDNDILIDSTRGKDVQRIMESLGFTAEHVGKGNHDVYFRQPVSNFEMHTSLFGKFHDEKIYEYYLGIRDKLIKDDDNGYGYHFSDEDMYIYLTSHEYKHYSNGGTGIRSFIDIYIYMKEYADKLDMDYIAAECEKLGIADFERQSRSLALDLFGGGKLTDEDKEMLRYIVFSGTFGTRSNMVKNKLEKFGGGTAGKLRYVFDRLFLSMEKIQYAFPFFYEHKILIPLLPFYRAYNCFIHRRSSMKIELRSLLKGK